MKRAHVTLDDGQEAEVLVREFRVDQSLGREPEVKIEGFLTKLGKREPQAPELMVTNVIYNDPATVVYWSDKTRTVVKCQPDDKFDSELGFLLALCKKVCGNTGKYNDLLRECIPGYGGEKTKTEPSVEQMRKELHYFCGRSICNGCPLSKDGFECGRGKSFTTPKYGLGYMTDESIVKHYKAMKGAEEDGHE